MQAAERLEQPGALSRVTERLGIAGTLSVAFMAAICLVAIFAPWLAPHDPLAINVANVFGPPSPEHLLGTDSLGRDILSRLIWGSRTALLGPLAIVAISGALAAAIAMTAAWNRGWVDLVIGRIIDIQFAFPAILLALLVTAVFNAGFWPAIVALAIASVPHKARLLRSAALRERAQPYIEALEVQGMSGMAITMRHLFPAVLPLFTAQLVLSFGYATVELAAISFIGLGIQAPASDWGLMVAQGQATLIQGQYREAVSAGICIILVVTAVTIIGDRLSHSSEGHA